MATIIHDMERFYKISKKLFMFFLWANLFALVILIIALILGIRYAYLIPTNPRWIPHNGTIAPLIQTK